MKKKAETQLLAIVPDDLAKALRKRLIDDDISYKQWLVERIEEYLGIEKGGKK